MKRFSVALILVLALSGLALSPPVAAERDAQRISERTYQQLSRAHALMKQGRYEDALANLDRLRTRVERRRDELALLLQSYGHLYASQEMYPQAIAALSRSAGVKRGMELRGEGWGRDREKREGECQQSYRMVSLDGVWVR